MSAVLLAARFAQELGLPAGNMWEPGITRHIARFMADGHTAAEAETHYRMQLGLSSGEPQR